MHSTKPKQADVILYFALSYLEEYHDARKASTSINPNDNLLAKSASRDAPWLNPPSGRLKLKTYVAVDTMKEITSCGAVLRNCSSDIAAAMKVPFRGCFKPEIMEAMALMHNLKWLQELHLPLHFMEIDSLLVVKRLQSTQMPVSDFDCLLDNISLLVSNFPSAHISHVYRSANNAAHLLAKFVLSVDTKCS
uniref:RNase H type-1 domain-containing protein n=1 Tax=Cannabis sativa TaxID=3483 RepID=A0A803Q1L0_CANSA